MQDLKFYKHHNRKIYLQPLAHWQNQLLDKLWWIPNDKKRKTSRSWNSKELAKLNQELTKWKWKTFKMFFYIRMN